MNMLKFLFLAYLLSLTIFSQEEPITDLIYIQNNCKGEGIYKLLDCYKKAMEGLVEDLEKKQRLEAFRKFIDSNAHIIKEHPEQVIPLAFNRSHKGYLTEAARGLLKSGKWQGKALLVHENRPEIDESPTLLRTLDGHKTTVTSVAISPDNKYVVSGSCDTTNIWDMGNGTLLRTLNGHSNSVAISVDGKHVVLGCGDFLNLNKAITIWDMQSGGLIRSLEGYGSSANSVAISTDSKYVVSGSEDNTIVVWKLADGKFLTQY